MFRTILVAVDGSLQASAALDVAVDLATHYHAKLCIVHAFPHVSDLLGTPYYEQLLAARTLIGEQIIEAARTRVGNQVVAETHLLEGPAAAAILRVADAEGSDLIVVGSRGQSPIRNLLLGSVSSAITQHAPCPVLVVRGLREQVEEPEDVTPVPAT